MFAPAVRWLSIATLTTACVGVRVPPPPPIASLEDLRVENAAALVEASRDAAVPTRIRAVRAMGRIGTRSYIPALVAAADPGEPAAVREEALFALGLIGSGRKADRSEAAVAAVRRALDDRRVAVATAAVEAFGRLARVADAHELLPSLRHRRPEVRREAALALFRLRFLAVWRGDTETAPPLPAAATEGLLAAFLDEDVEVRRAAVVSFSRYPHRGDPEMAALARALGDPDEWVRLFAVRALGRAEDADVAASLDRVTADPSPRVRTEALLAAEARGVMTERLEALTRDPSFHVRAAAMRALRREEGERARLALEAGLEDPSVTVRTAALEALAVAAPLDDALDRLGRGLASADWRMRLAAIRGSAGLGEPGVELVRRGATDPDGRVRAAALAAWPGDPGTEPTFLRALADDDLAVRATAAEAIAGVPGTEALARIAACLDRSLGPEWVELRETLALTLGGRQDARALLERLATDPAASVRTRAREGLSALGVSDPHLPVHAGDPPSPSPFLERIPVTRARVRLETERGDITLELFPEDAPLHVASFLELISGRFYDGLIWHRVVSNFVVQGGDPAGSGWGGPGYTLRDEINRRRYGRGTLGMPKAGKDTGGCQLFLTHVPTPHLDGLYTVFGRVVEGLDVLDRLEVGDRILRARQLQVSPARRSR